MPSSHRVTNIALSFCSWCFTYTIVIVVLKLLSPRSSGFHWKQCAVFGFEKPALWCSTAPAVPFTGDVPPNGHDRMTLCVAMTLVVGGRRAGSLNLCEPLHILFIMLSSEHLKSTRVDYFCLTASSGP